ncbi:MAG: acetolactate synthase large subunit [Myxococcota bacterium]|nr:acetolactate synthase large subunit [Myxococcota bacterium]
MNGAEALIRTLVQAGVEVCFTNPGTSEMHFVAALDRAPGMRPVLGLFEGIVSGAADGYARMAEKPASTLLHLGPGLANGLANFHNARKARSPILSLVGDHALSHQGLDAPLSADVEGFAAPVSCWVRSARDPRRLAQEGAEALAAACRPPGGVATLVVPADVAWGEAGGPAAALPLPKRDTVAPARVAAAAAALRSGEPAALLMSGQALRAGALESAGRVAQATGARLFCDTFNARLERGAGRVAISPLPYFAESVVDTLDGTRHLVVVGTQAPVAFFAYPDKPGALTPAGCAVHVLADPAEDAPAALEALADELGARAPGRVERLAGTASPRGALDPASIGASLAELLPEGAIVSDESISASLALLPASRGARPHDWLFLTGGAIGQGIPLATGAAVACPGRKVVCLQADGSAMYTIQGLWTQAREGLDVTTVILANRSYAILQTELARVGAGEPGQRARDMLEIGRPDLDFVKLAAGMGVPASRVARAEDFHARFAEAMAEPGPTLIEAVY